MKKTYQIEAQRAVKRFEAVAAKEEPLCIFVDCYSW
jgi:hypothetical protein